MKKNPESAKKEIHSLDSPYLIIHPFTLIIMDANDAAIALLEYPKEELIKMHVFDLVHESRIEATKENADLYRNQKVYAANNIYKTKSGKLLQVRIVATRIAYLKKACWQVLIKTVKK